ncbi:PHO85 interacting cyclin [Yamadazyma tenuis]|uniref:Cyclin N-terminal domain-containing protein n=1 Tax=Candida tenuis (strain ATCC 10573 / BCRC 21748 / CBS 615 / JCM 9827 / NBRC 10315 / NRRL Y-1498 / VKM Y-70) TaxID=590646 RepID=G3B376_CANTC|nr:uncharacterized protein CANTEDRAFT_105790 [Yamadazyma tenuis ATCC 10573]EGV64098.1 hypothetical protein CANTEDRAFT_105790 [Yamadazyma tenuis ATCC 10573]WEJ96267.1 PHO85 interacting cyclin [Yamadazyma tenuis]
MSDREALKILTRQPVNTDMINFLVSTTNSIIQVKPPQRSPRLNCLHTGDMMISPVGHKTISLASFIKNLIKYSNVQTPTLMATLIYLNKLRNLLPANAIGMETTRHRIFLSSLILSAKCLNDSSPLNKHWTKYTDGLLTLDEVNMAERELISLLQWKVNVYEEDLIVALQPFLIPIKNQLWKKLSAEQNQKMSYYRLSNVNLAKPYSKSRSSSSSSISSFSSVSSPSLTISSSTSSLDSIGSASSYSKSPSTYLESSRPLQPRSVNSMNRAYHSKTYDSYQDINLMHSGRVIA